MTEPNDKDLELAEYFISLCDGYGGMRVKVAEKIAELRAEKEEAVKAVYAECKGIAEVKRDELVFEGKEGLASAVCLEIADLIEKSASKAKDSSK